MLQLQSNDCYVSNNLTKKNPPNIQQWLLNIVQHKYYFKLHAKMNEWNEMVMFNACQTSGKMRIRKNSLQLDLPVKRGASLTEKSNPL